MSLKKEQLRRVCKRTLWGLIMRSESEKSRTSKCLREGLMKTVTFSNDNNEVLK